MADKITDADSIPSIDGFSRRDLLRSLPAAVLGGSALLSATDTHGAAPSHATGTRRWHTVENTFITMSDGTKLAARLWLPDDATQRPVPAIMSYDPYHLRFFTRPYDDGRFPFFASHGYAGVRVDIRGSGDSDGLPQDEYVRQEQEDALEVIAWIARQVWCDGKVGMEGLSWSGFNSLQVAAQRPPALKAIITHCSADDRYADDAHYKGGAVLHDMFNWGNLFLAFQGLAPDPAIVGQSGWQARWLERLNHVPFNVASWMSHPHRDAFWKHASVCEDYSQISCPVYAVGGWVDAYKNTVFRLMQHLEVPRKGLVGPWTHIYPHEGVPGPAIGWLDEALRWWNHWLKGEDTGIMREPMLRVWLQEAVPTPEAATTPGRWVAESIWPNPGITQSTLVFNGHGRLTAAFQSEQRHDLEPLQTVGSASGNWCPSGGGGSADLGIEMALDQRLDDARSLVFDSEPLTAPLEIMGAARVALDLAIDQPVGNLAVRLNEVLPNGTSGRVTYGILNLCQRSSNEHPEAMVPDQRYAIEVWLDHAAHRFKVGSRIRVSLSTAYWPMILPSPKPVRLSVWSGASSLHLPVRSARPEDATLRSFGPPVVPEIPISVVRSVPGTRRVELDVGTAHQTIHHLVNNEMDLLPAIDTRIFSNAIMRCEIHDRDPQGATIDYRFETGWERDEIRTRVIAMSIVVAKATTFELTGRLIAHLGDEEIFSRDWSQAIPRELV